MLHGVERLGVVSAVSIALILLACLYGVVSGLNEGGNLLASFTAGRVISPRAAAALLLLVVLGPLVLGSDVARTISSDVIDLARQDALGFTAIVSISLGVVLVSWLLRVPTSMTLALVGAMLGWVLADASGAVIHWVGVTRVLVGMPVSVLGGGLLAWILIRCIHRLLGNASNARVLGLAKLQFVTAALEAIAYGANGLEKTVGLLAVARAIPLKSQVGTLSGAVPVLVAFLSFLFGALIGGWRLARHVGFGVVRVRPMQALVEQLSAAVIVAALARVGAPVSSTQAIDGALVGVGVGMRASAVRWGLVRQTLASWLVTLPLALAAAAASHALLRFSGVLT
jgi:inorganic phosphate transporter, PiT family